MKKLLILFSFFSLACYSQNTTKERQQLVRAFVYVHNQQGTLNFIKRQHPEKYIEADIAEVEFNKKYGVALSLIYREVQDIYKNSFDSYVLKLDSNLHSYFKSNMMSAKESSLYIEQVKKRTTGSIESSILKTLTKYQHTIISGFDSNTVYYVDSYAHGENIKLSIEVPTNWKEIDGSSSSVLKAFRSTGSQEQKAISIQRVSNSLGISSFSDKMLLSSIPQNSYNTLIYKRTVNGESIDVVEYEEVSPIPHSDQKRRTTRFYFLKGNDIFIIDCSTYHTRNLDALSQQTKSLFESIIKSVNFNYGKKNTLATLTDQN